MFPSPSGPPGNGGDDLEARLRGLILSNAGTQAIPETAQGAETKSQLPPHMLSATLAEQQDYLANLSLPRKQNFDSLDAQPGRKRPNQAQRRQINSRLSMDIEPRPSPATQGPGFGPGTGFDRSQWSKPPHNKAPQIKHNQGYPQHQTHSPRFQNNGLPSSFPSQPFSPQNSPRSPMHRYPPGSEPQIAFQQASNQYSQFQSRYAPRPTPHGRQLYQPNHYQNQGRGAPSGWGADDIATQSSYLETLLQSIVPSVHIDPQELSEKESFRVVVENACREAIAEYEINELGCEKFDPSTVELQCFGSMMSGFATKGSDMDLALLSPKSNPAPDSPESPIPRLLEKRLLVMGFGARLLTRTRVPIIKLCQKPSEKLKADLLQERTKWENGFIGGPQEEEDINEPGLDPEAVLEDIGNVAPEGRPQQTEECSESVVESYEEKLAGLKQKAQQSLGDYHNAAKRLLKNLGGRDVTSTNSSTLDEDELRILNDVCKAFVSGLSSQPLVSRLQSYPSISPLFDSSLPPIQRTLQGIMHQIEGERLSMAVDHRPLTEQSDKREHECLIAVAAWQTMQNMNRPVTVTESLRFNRDLYIALERMKRIRSLQLVFLHQIQHEEPVYYYGRAQKLLEDLQGYNRNWEGSTDTVTPIVVAHYLAGISNLEIRQALQKSTRTTMTLQRVGLQHRALQLAMDYENALKTHMYDEDDRPYIENYIAFLRRVDLTDPARIREKIPQTGDEAKLIAKIRCLPNPKPTKSRDRYKDHLEFPKSDIGVQCDINFSAHLAIHNTLLLRCYSRCDPRVESMVLFIKHWAKARGINTPYRGTLSSYGYVLMVLHYLVNVAQPLVCPNLQAVHKDPAPHLPPAEIEARSICNGHDVRFWRNELEIKSLAERKMLNHNHDSLGLLLRGFFEYFAMNGSMTTFHHRCFDWGRDVLSLRTQGGILSKQEKGWVGAKTTIETKTVAPPIASTLKASDNDYSVPAGEIRPGTAEASKVKSPNQAHMKTVQETKEVRHRFLFAIEDPFELDHNVARTVTHHGIVSIRDEFRRAWRIIRGAGKPNQTDGGLLDPNDIMGEATKDSWQELLDLIHGPTPKAEMGTGDRGPEKQ
ncbi:uncharacterized protein BP5553_09613 [Venustampulla echinocandica]|uniref:polynucleotide adenylyltransferase n=1 Tax=Venustampulla echinocandica TaxID=2656787 RepID=A0A370TBH4_9HELO|nr:uncharacterized protein BP5553_09613 [Venustampulla echinocandica]RDL31404.1 hypothetical protein BP5553_09613 [Venustampulla echinocandica]